MEPAQKTGLRTRIEKKVFGFSDFSLYHHGKALNQIMSGQEIWAHPHLAWSFLAWISREPWPLVMTDGPVCSIRSEGRSLEIFKETGGERVWGVFPKSFHAIHPLGYGLVYSSRFGGTSFVPIPSYFVQKYIRYYILPHSFPPTKGDDFLLDLIMDYLGDLDGPPKPEAFEFTLFDPQPIAFPDPPPSRPVFPTLDITTVACSCIDEPEEIYAYSDEDYDEPEEIYASSDED